jgi:hypothetical protein
MPDKKRPSPPPRPPREGDDVRKGGGWQRPVQPPSQVTRPDGLPPKKSS